MKTKVSEYVNYTLCHVYRLSHIPGIQAIWTILSNGCISIVKHSQDNTLRKKKMAKSVYYASFDNLCMVTTNYFVFCIMSPFVICLTIFLYNACQSGLGQKGEKGQRGLIGFSGYTGEKGR